MFLFRYEWLNMQMILKTSIEEIRIEQLNRKCFLLITLLMSKCRSLFAVSSISFKTICSEYSTF
ncbi:MAG: hypothetical protein AABZ43_07940, partial [Planctomycetota bacterium]